MQVVDLGGPLCTLRDIAQRAVYVARERRGGALIRLKKERFGLASSDETGAHVLMAMDGRESVDDVLDAMRRKPNN